MKLFRSVFTMAALAALCACGVETAGTAATSAAIKKQEVEQGKNTMREAQEKVDAAAKQVEARTAAAAASSEK